MRLNFKIVLYCFALSFVSGQTSFAEIVGELLSSSTTHEQAFQEAITAMREGRLVEAEAKLAEALHQAPANPEYHFEMANLYALKHDEASGRSSRQDENFFLEKVAQQLDHTLMLDPEFLPARYNLAVTYKRLGYYERAREELRRVLVKAEERQDWALKSNALMQVGAVYEEQGFFEEARFAYLEARDFDYANPDVRGALENLKEHQAFAEERARRQDVSRSIQSMQNVQQGLARPGLSALTRQNNPYQAYGSSDSAASEGAAKQQAVMALGTLLAQQFLGRHTASREE